MAEHPPRMLLDHPSRAETHFSAFPKKLKPCTKSTRESPCFVDPTRPSQTKYCNVHGEPRRRAKDWRQANPFPYSRETGKLERESRNYNLYMREYRLRNLNKIRAHNRRAAAKARAKKKHIQSASLLHNVLRTTQISNGEYNLLQTSVWGEMSTM